MNETFNASYLYMAVIKQTDLPRQIGSYSGARVGLAESSRPRHLTLIKTQRHGNIKDFKQKKLQTPARFAVDMWQCRGPPPPMQLSKF